MNRQEFLKELQRALTGQLSNEEITEHIEYYSQYIEVGARKGDTETEMIMMLGDPKLLAKTILAARSKSQFEKEMQHGGMLNLGYSFLKKIKNKIKEIWKRLE